MTRTVYFVAASIDGFIADAEGELDWLFQFDGAPGIAEHYQAFLSSVGALAMGAATYEFLLRHAPDAWPYPAHPSWVLTHRELPVPAGADVRLTSDEVGAVHAELVRAAGEKDVWIVGGGNVVAQFARRGLLDEIMLAVVPVVLGAGTPLLPASIPGPLELASVTRFGRGVVELRYSMPSAPR